MLPVLKGSPPVLPTDLPEKLRFPLTGLQQMQVRPDITRICLTELYWIEALSSNLLDLGNFTIEQPQPNL